MKIAVIGTRGIPDIQGGVETHCEELYPRLVKKGCKIILFTRLPYVKEKKINNYKGVELKHVYAPKLKSLEAITHSILCSFLLLKIKPDLVHIHAIGPALITPLIKILGFKVVMTHHGPDYKRKKWGIFAKLVLKIGELLGVKFSDKIIAISKIIQKEIKNKYKKESILIYNGVNIPQIINNYDVLKKYDLKTKSYIISVGRFVEEKGFHDLINAYKLIKTDYKLVIVGDADHETKYSKMLKTLIKENKNIVGTGIIKGDELNILYRNAALFVLPSYYEGLPIVLLEAMSYNLDVLVSDIPQHKEVELEDDDYFRVGNIEDLKNKLEKKLNNLKKRNFIELIKNKYNWDLVANKVYEVYKSII